MMDDFAAEEVVLSVTDANLTGHVEKVGLDSFELLKVLGTGAYGKVFLVRKACGHDMGQLYAMKVLKKASIVTKQKTTEHTMTERQVLEAVRQSPFLVTLHYAFQTNSRLHLILDYVNGGEMFTHLNTREKFTEPEVQLFSAEILLALEHLHKLGIVYRDIKLENILLDSEGHVVLTDFGLSKEFINKGDRTFSFCGTIEYMAPEVIRSNGAGHDFAVDFWSLGVLMYELLTGASPFTVEGERNSQAEVSRRILYKHPPLPKGLSSAALDVILKLLDKNPKTRLGCGTTGVKEIKEHPYYKSLDWEKVARKDVPAPFKPVIANDMDTSNFAEEFTLMPVNYSPAPTPATNASCPFKGYSFVSPSVVFGRQHVLSDDLLKPMSNSGRPSPSYLQKVAHAGRLTDSEFFTLYELDLDTEPLGDGSFSVCRKCVELSTGREFAVKIISRRWELQSMLELRSLSHCQGHPNIVKLYNVFQDKHHTYIVMELLHGGELLSMIRDHPTFNEAEASIIMKQIVSAVAFMHEKGIVHRDLKPENIIFVQAPTDTNNNTMPASKQLHIKIVDFGFARLKPNTGAGASVALSTPVFTLQYAAPEVLQTSGFVGTSNTPGYDESCDLWSIGVILYAVLSGAVPFVSDGQSLRASEIMTRITKGEFTFDGLSWQNVSEEARRLVDGLLTVDPKKRLKISDLLASPWVQGACAPTTPLLSPCILSPGHRATTCFNATMKAYHLASKEGFQLSAVTNAPIAKRRNRKRTGKQRNGSDTRSSSGSNDSVVLTSSTAATSSSSCSTPGASPVTSPAVEVPASALICANFETVSSPVAKRPRGLDLVRSTPSDDQYKLPSTSDSVSSGFAENIQTGSDRESSDSINVSSPSLSRQASSSLSESGYGTYSLSSSSPPYLSKPLGSNHRSGTPIQQLGDTII
uniref:ribosomal protein S6 kinase alpha-5 n=1 Tax=Ciona intestinalis TaxID=7719 RepID=UPI000180C2A1|nr:ribosomal protein S6 kinase alpha-5 [Ciona intestinalis]|eukprot:XP_002123049.3 ribosomal protein S6 kinase alpha-5 [Ciona intestinalis]